jgi:hypothetical protein
MDPIEVIIEGKAKQVLSRERVYDMLMKNTKNLEKAINCFVLEDDYCDSIKIVKENGELLVKFHTWSCGAPETHTYTNLGKRVSWYNAEYGEEVFYEDTNTEEDTEETDAEETDAEETEVKEEREENNMNTTVEAKGIVETVKDGLKSASEIAMSLCDDVAKEAKIISALSQTEAENHINKKYGKSADKFISWILEKLNLEFKRSQDADEILGEDSPETSRLKKAIADFKAVKAAGDKKGWKKFTALLKAVFGIVFAMFIEAAKLVLKLAFTLAVGVISIGACGVLTLASCIGVVANDAVRPVYGAAKKAHAERKGAKAAKNVGIDKVLAN